MLPLLAHSTNSALTGSLFKQRPDHAFLLNASVPRAPPGACGSLSAIASAWTPTTSLQTRSGCSKSLPSASTSRRPVRSRNVEDTLRGVGQVYAGLGAADPRQNHHGKVDFRLSSLYQAWAKADPPPSRVKPLSMPLLRQVVDLAHRAQCPIALVEARLLTVGVFFLLRPGEYMGGRTTTEAGRTWSPTTSMKRSPISVPVPKGPLGYPYQCYGEQYQLKCQ